MMAFDRGRDTAWHVHERENISLREEFAEHFQTFLTTAHTG
jgi:hypothetical protein